jgi:hypothetical protein
MGKIGSRPSNMRWFRNGRRTITSDSILCQLPDFEMTDLSSLATTLPVDCPVVSWIFLCQLLADWGIRSNTQSTDLTSNFRKCMTGKAQAGRDQASSSTQRVATSAWPFTASPNGHADRVTGSMLHALNRAEDQPTRPGFVQWQIPFADDRRESLPLYEHGFALKIPGRLLAIAPHHRHSKT